MTEDAFPAAPAWDTQFPAWDKIFDLYRSRAAKTEEHIFRASLMAHDLGVKATVVNQWRRRGNIPVDYWPRLVTVLERKFGLLVSERQLVQATRASRCRKREAA